MITIYESERLCQLIRDKNFRQEIDIGNHKLSFDQNSQKIILTTEQLNNYTGRKEEINLLPRLTAKCQANKSFEAHLQAYIVKTIGKRINVSLDNCILGQNLTFEWLGNEGILWCRYAERIDVMISTIANGQTVLIPIELKSVEGRHNQRKTNTEIH